MKEHDPARMGTGDPAIMLCRRHFTATLGALALAGCAGRSRIAAVPRRPPATATPVSDPTLFGLNAVIDINHANAVNDFTLARGASGILGVVHKASEGDWLDPLYGVRRALAQAAGLLWGAYHFGTHEHSGAEQAMAFLQASQPDASTLIALDLELNERNPGNSMDIVQAEDFVRTIFGATGRLPLLYVHPVWADGEPVGGYPHTLGGAIRRGSALAACDLWLADYRSQPELPQAWGSRGWRFWQYTGDDPHSGGPFRVHARAVQGIDRCDRSLFAGDAVRLLRYWTAEAGRTGTA
jgi:lysozyme